MPFDIIIIYCLGPGSLILVVIFEIILLKRIFRHATMIEKYASLKNKTSLKNE